MSKALEYFEDMVKSNQLDYNDEKVKCDLIRNCLLSLDIIKNKKVDTKYLISIIRDKYIKGKANKVWIYNSSVSEEDELTEKEYDLLNEVLK